MLLRTILLLVGTNAGLLNLLLLVSGHDLSHLQLYALKVVEDLTHLDVVLGLNLVGESDAQLTHNGLGEDSDLIQILF